MMEPIDVAGSYQFIQLIQYLSALSLAVPGDGGFQAFRRQGLLSDLGGFVIGSTMRKAVSRVIVASSTSIYDVLHFLR